jgi:hypothetical protein
VRIRRKPVLGVAALGAGALAVVCGGMLFATDGAAKLIEVAAQAIK